MLEDDLPADGQADAGALTRTLGGGKRLKQDPSNSGVDAAAVSETSTITWFPHLSSFDPDLIPVGIASFDGLACVDQQVDEDLTQTYFVSDDGRIAVDDLRDARPQRRT